MLRLELEPAVEAGIITRDQADRLTAFLEARRQAAAAQHGPAMAPAKFDFSHVLWYAGALIVISALGLFTTLAFVEMGPQALTFTAIAYGAGFVALGRFFWGRPGLMTPGGLLIACAVNMVPMAIYGVQATFELWPLPFGDPGNYESFYDWLNASWVYMDIGTVLAGVLALRYFPFPFIAAIMAGALWFLSMDLVPWVAYVLFKTQDFTWSMRDAVSMWLGVTLIVAAWGLDLKRWRAGDFAFWLHLAGVICFWCSLSAHSSDNGFLKFVYFLINVAMVILAVFLGRRVYAVFGAFGISLYLGYLASDVFVDSLLFPLALSAIGLGVIGLGIWYFRKQQVIALWLVTTLPPGLQRLRPAHARMVQG